MKRHQWVFGIAVSSILLLNGCKHCCKRNNCPQTCPNNVPPPGFQNLPPQNVPLNPGVNSRAAPEVLLPANVPPGTSGYSPPTSKGGTFLGEPDFSTPKAGIEEKAPPAKQTPLPPMIEEGNTSPFPVAIANFAEVSKNVSSGIRPNSLDGFDWLRSNGYKTVLFLRSEKADSKKDDSSDRDQARKRGMNYVSLTITPEKLNQDLVNEFNRTVNDAQGRPIFVYDDVNGSVAGPMWFLYFRTSDRMDNDEAIVRAHRHGLKEKGDDEQTRLLTAIQKYLSERKN
jgi:protein tyrosine phosphatase (PTP) superfamily phosphohydrolase (DUF442 family)